MIKKVSKLLVLILLTSFVFIPSAKALTIQDYRSQLEDLKSEKANAEANAAAIQEEINRVNAEVAQIVADIESVTNEKKVTEDEIKALGVKIDEKQQQIKDLVSFYQVSDNENFYLKYLLGSETFEDFIYRFSVIEQLTTKCDELVNEMTDLVEQNKQKVLDLEAKDKELNSLKEQAHDKLVQFSNQKTAYSDTSMDLDTQIEIVQDKIDRYVSAGCGETENLNTCLTTIPFDYGFSRPLTTGYVNDEFGMRLHPVTGVWKNHNGIDIGGNSEGTPVYAAAAGKVVDVMHGYYCGGNIVTINHNINGVSYTTRYWHMLRTSVNEGDIVEKGEKVGEVGGGSTSYINGGYDQCTTGTHLHFEMAYGHYYGSGDGSYTSWSTYTSKVFNPRDMVYFPAYGVRW